MSLTTCHECKNQVSTEAKTCPTCGAKVKKPTSIVTKGFLVLLAIGLITAIANNPKVNPKPEKTPEEQAKDLAAGIRYTMAKSIAEKIKATMRDPESFVLEKMYINDDSTIVCSEYRAKNGFGGMNREFLVITKDKTSTKPADWNKHCTKPMHDMKYAVQ